ncbi:hypothetical protein L195_g057775, partial [Trifolium pratense]
MEEVCVAVVVDECDSTMGCDQDHDYQPPCRNNIVDASKRLYGKPWVCLEINGVALISH